MLFRILFHFLFIFISQDFVNLFYNSNFLRNSDISDSSRINFLSSWMVSAFCPSNCRCNDNKLEAVCSNASLTIIPITLNPNMRKILLNSNQIVKLSTDSFSVYRNIESLDLSHNKLDTLEDYSFRGLSKLKTLHLNGNKLLVFTNSTFNGLSGLEDLYLNDNLLSNLNDSVFKGLLNLKQLNLNRNRLNYLEPRAFDGLKNLRTLFLVNNSLNMDYSSLSNDQLSSTPSTFNSSSLNLSDILVALSPRYLPNLMELHLGGNNFPSIKKENSPFFSGMDPSESITPSDSSDFMLEQSESNNQNHHYSHESSKRRESHELKFWSNLQELSLEGCSISSIESGALNGLPKLTTLRLNNNNFQQVPKDIFSDLGKLEVLQIGGNPFTTINSTSFTTLTSLKSLDISRCPHLNTIESGAFNGLDKLELLEISYNPNLHFIDSTLFDPLVSLKILILTHNSFTFLDNHLSLIANRVKLFDVRGNPFTCNCSVQWIRKLFLQNINDTNSEVSIKGLSSSSVNSPTSSTTESSKGVNEVSVKREPASAFPAAARRIAPNPSVESSSFIMQSSSDTSSNVNKIIRVTCANPMPLRGKQIIDLEPGDIGCYEVESMAPIVIGVFIGCLIITGVVVICGIRWRTRLTGLIKGTTGVGSKRSHHYPAKIGASSMVGGIGSIGSVMGGVGGSGRKIFGMMSHNPIRTNDLDYGPYSKPECIVVPGYNMESTTIINNLNNPYEIVPLSGSLHHDMSSHTFDRISSIVGGFGGFTSGPIIGNTSNSLIRAGFRSNLSVGVGGVGGGGGCGSDSSSYEGEYHYPIVSNLRTTPITEL
ncbi:slit homolog 3 protein [Tetranychus urticae]|uniref:LRRCT domain-containing protein n=1 Tax=Tetranychus urticae TaxID=32264 RepID=T1L0E6_TETUR|nr:slit homolog 3 protein [Tetranychus urticae]